MAQGWRPEQEEEEDDDLEEIEDHAFPVNHHADEFHVVNNEHVREVALDEHPKAETALIRQIEVLHIVSCEKKIHVKKKSFADFRNCADGRACTTGKQRIEEAK